MSDMRDKPRRIPRAVAATDSVAFGAGRRSGFGLNWIAGFIVLIIVLALIGWGWGGWYGGRTGTIGTAAPPGVGGTAGNNPSAPAQRVP